MPKNMRENIPHPRINKYAALDAFCAAQPECAVRAIEDALKDACKAMEGSREQLSVVSEPCHTRYDKTPRMKLRIQIADQGGRFDATIAQELYDAFSSKMGMLDDARAAGSFGGEGLAFDEKTKQYHFPIVHQNLGRSCVLVDKVVLGLKRDTGVKITTPSQRMWALPEWGRQQVGQFCR